MHELTLCGDMVEVITEKMKTRPGQKVKKVVLEVGKHTALLPDAFKFCFDLCAKDTVVEGAALDIVELTGVGVCQRCARKIESDVVFGFCPCGAEIEWISGSQLKIKHLEVE